MNGEEDILEIAVEALREIAGEENAYNPMAISKPCCQRFDEIAHDALNKINELKGRQE